MADFAGYSTQDLSQFFGGMDPATVDALVAAMGGQAPNPQQQQLLGSLDPTTLQNVQGGFQHLSEHPQGSQYHGDFNPNALGSDFVRTMTGGVVSPQGNPFDFGDYRVNVPYSSAQMRDMGKGWGNMLTAGQFRPEINQALDTPEARLAGGAIGGVAGAATGYGLASALGAGAGTAMAAGGAVPMAYQLAGMLTPQQQEGPGGPGPGPGVSQGPGGLTPQQLAALSAAHSQPHQGLAPTFEARAKGKPIAPGLAGQEWSG